MIMELHVVEIVTTANSTASLMTMDGKPFSFVIEDGFREKKVAGETRIPAGRYQVVKRTNGKFFNTYRNLYGHQFSLEIKSVPQFSDVLIHIGNTIKDTRGCLLVNRKIGMDPTGTCFGEDSSSVYRLLYELIARAFDRNEEVWLNIERQEKAV